MTDTVATNAVRDTGAVDRDNPWPGLAAFRETDREFFYGREAATETVFELVSRERVAILYGASGLGKTSLIQAGLFPKGRAADLFPVRIRLRFGEEGLALGEQIAAALLHEAADKHIEAPAREPNETLWEFFYRKDALWWSERHRILTPLLVLDQFEEIFTIGRRTAAAASASHTFLQELKGLIFGLPPDAVKARCDENPDEALRYSLARCPVRVLFSFREDYLAEFLELRELLPTVGENDYRLLRMSPTDAERVILGAGQRLVTSPVAGHIVQIIAGARAKFRTEDLTVDPALLSVFCRELNNERRNLGQPQITDELLTDNQATILENFYYRSIEGLDPRVQVFIEDELLLPDSPERNSVAEQIALRRPGVTADAIERLIDRRLLRRDERDGPARLELSHDVLIEPVRRSRDLRLLREHEEKRLADLRAAEEQKRRELAEAHEKERQQLQLAEAEARRANADAEAAQARAQLAERRVAFGVSQRRRLGIFLIVTAILLVVAVLFAVFNSRNQQRARQALASALISGSAKSAADGRNDMALAYLAYAARMDPANDFARGRLANYLLYRTWPLPVAILRHRGAVLAAQFSPDGARLLTADDQLGVSLWPTQGSVAKPERRLTSTGAVLARFDVSGRFVVTLRTDGGAELWDLGPPGAQPSSQHQWPLPSESGRISAAAFSPDGKLLATGSQSGAVQVWRVASPAAPFNQFDSRHGAISALQFSRDASRLLLASADATASIWSLATGTRMAQFAGHRSVVVSAQFSPDESRMVTASIDGTARVWALTASGQLTPSRPPNAERGASGPSSTVLQHNGAVWSARFSPDGQRVLTASEDGYARLWFTGSGTLAAPPMEHHRAVLSAVFDRSGTLIVTASKDNSARVWDADSGGAVTEPMWHDRAVEAATFSPDGRYVATASDDGSAEVWDVRSRAARPNAINIGHTAYSVQFNPKGESVLVGSKEDGTARIWDPSADEPSHAIPYQTESSWPEFDADGTALLGVQGSTVRVWSTATWQPTSAAPMNHQGPLATARLSPDGARVATISYEPLPGRGGMRRVVRLWDAATGTALQPLRLPDDSERLTFTWVEFSQDSQWIVAGADDNSDSEIQRGVAIVWNVARPDPIGEVDSRYAPVYFASLSPARDSVLTFGSRSTTALVWPVKPESAPGLVEHEGAALGHDNAVLFAQFSTDGHHIVTTSEDGTAKLWRYPIGASAPIVLQHKQPVDWAEFSADGKRVVTTARDGTARIWDANNGDLAAETPIDSPIVVPMARFSADGQRVATAAEDGWVRIWNVPYGTPADAIPLADLAEAVSGYAVNAEGAVERIDHLARLDAERARHTTAQASTQSMSGRIAGWFFADRAQRPISPFSTKIAEPPPARPDADRKD